MLTRESTIVGAQLTDNQRQVAILAAHTFLPSRVLLKRVVDYHIHLKCLQCPHMISQLTITFVIKFRRRYLAGAQQQKM